MNHKNVLVHVDVRTCRLRSTPVINAWNALYKCCDNFLVYLPVTSKVCVCESDILYDVHVHTGVLKTQNIL